MHRKNRAKPPKKILKGAKKISKRDKKLKNHKKNLKPRPKPPLKPQKNSTPQIQLNSRAFKSLQREWYARLKADGFRDLESQGDQDGLLSTRGAQPQALFQEAALDGRELYYRRLTNFITHNPNWSADKLHNLVATLYVEGVSYRNMLPIVKQRLKKRTNIWRIHKIIKTLEARAKLWNKVNPEGLDFEADLQPRFKPAL